MYERLTGLKSSNLVGRPVKTLTTEGIFDTIVNPKIVKTGKPATSVQTDRKGKKLILNGHPIFDDNGVVALVVTFVRDMTLMNQLREQIISQRRLIDKYRTNVKYLNEERERPLITHSPAILKLNRKVRNFAVTDATVLLQGETGVGKDIYARRIHQESARSEKPFIKVDCPTISEALFESELFGYVPGAFTGAHGKGKMGFLEVADGGTLFLDEVGELPLGMQAKLLLALQDREFIRVGSTKIRKLDVRVIAATNRDLEKEIKDRRFRSDLFYRLQVAVITIPPLRERREDIVPLAKHFRDRYANRYKKNLHFDPIVLEAFSSYRWPGNVREIKNLIQSLTITNQNNLIRLSDLPSNMVGHIADTCRDPAPVPSTEQAKGATESAFIGLQPDLEEGDRSLKSIMSDIEREILSSALEKHGSHVKVAKLYKIDRSTLFRKLRTEQS
jgi:transcriptional regulator with PAS, ATPase and Fis domain